MFKRPGRNRLDHLVILGLVVLLVFGAHKCRATELTEGSLAPVLSLPTLRGDTFSTDDHGSERLLVYVWSAMGQQMKDDILLLQKLTTQMDPQRLKIITVLPFAEDVSAVREYYRDRSIGLVTLLNEGGAVEESWGLGSQLPVAFSLDEKGTVVSRYEGELSEQILQELTGFGLADETSLSVSQQETLPNKCLHLDGQTGWLATNDSRMYRFSDAMSVELLVLFEPDACNWDKIIIKPHVVNAAPYYTFSLFKWGNISNQIVFAVTTSSMEGQWTDPITVPEKRWFHVCGTYDGNEIKLFIDGDLKGTKYTGGPMSANTMPIAIGKYPYGAAKNPHGQYVKGSLDELRLWNRALSQAEIRQYMHRQRRGDEEGLVLYYDFDHLLPDGKVRDLTHYENHGVPQGNARAVSSDAPVSG